MYHIIYKTTNLINNKIYIGQHKTDNLDDGYLGSGLHLRRAIKKYGKQNFKREILFTFDNFDDMNNKEIELVTEEFVLREDNYNLRLGGHRGKLSDESIDKFRKSFSEQYIKENHPMYGKTHSDEIKEFLSDHSSARTQGEDNPMFGIAHSQESIDKMKESHKHRPTVTCPHCNKTGAKCAMVRFHFDNCKSKS